jgi:hypothetical protein
MPEGHGSIAMIEGAGHYPHAQFPDQVAAAVLSAAHGFGVLQAAGGFGPPENLDASYDLSLT